MFTTKMRAVAAIALAATAALAVAGSAQAGPIKPKAADPGDVQLLTTDGNTSLVHTIRHNDGSWQHFGRIDGYIGVVGLTSTLLTGEENVFFQYTGANGPQLAHFVRHADGTWNFNASVPAGGSVDGLAVTAVNNQLALVERKGGDLQLSIQGTDGTWSSWAAVPTGGHKVLSVALAADITTLRVVELTADGKSVGDFDLSSDGTWSSGVWKTINTDTNYTATEVAAAQTQDGLQIAATQSFRGMFNSSVVHSVLHGNGNWDGFQSIAGVINNYYGAAHVAMASYFGEMQLTFSTSGGQLFHTIRDYRGNWQRAGDVEGIAGNVTAGQVTIAGFQY